MKKLFSLVMVSILVLGLLAACAAPAAQTAAPSAAGKLKVFGAYATPIEEPWDGVIHAALQKAADAGKIEYTYQDNIGYSGDMERILTEVATQQKPAVIFGDAFGNEEADIILIRVFDLTGIRSFCKAAWITPFPGFLQ